MGRLLSIDFGKKRTGIAVSDPLKIIANVLKTVPTSELLTFLSNYLQQEEVETIIIGLPTQTDGTPSENQMRVKQFATRLKKEHPRLSIVFYDERFTTVIAQRVIRESGIGKMKRRDKGLVDEISACIILQDYMNTL